MDASAELVHGIFIYHGCGLPGNTGVFPCVRIITLRADTCFRRSLLFFPYPNKGLGKYIEYPPPRRTAGRIMDSQTGCWIILEKHK